MYLLLRMLMCLQLGLLLRLLLRAWLCKRHKTHTHTHTHTHSILVFLVSSTMPVKMVWESSLAGGLEDHLLGSSLWVWLHFHGHEEGAGGLQTWP